MATNINNPANDGKPKTRYYHQNKEKRLEYQRQYRKDLREGKRLIQHRNGTTSNQRTSDVKKQEYIKNEKIKREAKKKKKQKKQLSNKKTRNKKIAEEYKRLNEEFEKEYANK